MYEIVSPVTEINRKRHRLSDKFCRPDISRTGDSGFDRDDNLRGAAARTATIHQATGQNPLKLVVT